jgi:hypothetical protein
VQVDLAVRSTLQQALSPTSPHCLC